MPVTRERKEELIAQISQDLQKAQAIIITDYRGLPTAELAKLRNELRGQKAGLHVVKNTLMELALKRANLPAPEDLLDGTTAVAFCFQDIAGPAKSINDFLRDKENIKIKGAIMSGSVLRGAEAEALANLPTRDQLFGKLLGTINAPGQQVAGVVASGIRQVLYLLKARIEQLEKQGASA